MSNKRIRPGTKSVRNRVQTLENQQQAKSPLTDVVQLNRKSMKLETFTDFRTPRKTFQRLLQELFFFSGYQLRILIAIRSWLMVTIGSKGREKNQKSRFFDNISIWPSCSFLYQLFEEGN